MIDWFVVLTPVLLLPIALLFLFVGCILVYRDVDPVVTFDITFYVENERLSHEFEFTVFDSMVSIDGDKTDNIKVVDGGNNTSQVCHRFHRHLEPNPVTLSCEVVDRNQEYFVTFVAEVSSDGMMPCREFDRCRVAVV
jgi:hypothetical protein